MLIVIFFFRITEARVFCEDSNAMSWMVHGYSCPVICASVQNAIQRLIMLDYKKTLHEQLGQQKLDPETLDIADEDRILRYNTKANILNKNTFIPDKAFKKASKELSKDIIKNLQIADFDKDIKNLHILRRDNSENDTDVRTEAGHKCWHLDKFKPSLLVGKIVKKKCTRRSNFDGKFLTIMTNILNKYVDTNFKFTEEMTEILLENIFGQNTDLRNNIFDVNKLLKYLRKSVNLHKSHSHVITLKSRNCLRITIPGCYCKPGYVESSGQCVRPIDCIREKHNYKYLKRIIVI